jgi:hypothetical protein
MPWWGWILIAIGILIVLGLVASMALTRRRSSRLRDRFGPEYDRVAGETESKRAAEAELAEREQRRESFDIRDLPETSRARYVEQWRSVQADFVDAPQRAAESADSLLQEVMAERGYPVEDFDQRAADLSTDHPEVVQNYRAGHALVQSSMQSGSDNGGSTEDLRQAMNHYRALFEELVERAPSEAARRD